MPVIRQRSGASWLGTSAPSATAIACSVRGVAAPRGGGGEPQRRRRVGRAAAHPGGDRHALGDRDPDRRPVPAGRRAEAGERRGGEVLALDAGADDLVGVAGGRLELELVGQRDGLHERHERVVAVGAGAADEQAQVDLAGRVAAQRGSRAPAPRAARATRPGASCSARASAGGRSPRAPPARGRGCRARRPGASASERGERLAAVREAVLHQRAQRGLGRGAAARQARPGRSRRSARDGRRYATPAAAPSRRRPAGRARTARRRRASRRARRSARRPPSAPSRPRS